MSTEAPTAVGSAPTAVATSSYPINFQADHPVHPSRLFAVPLLGYLIRGILLIPHFFALYIVNAIAEVVAIVASIIVLTSGKYPESMAGWTGGSVRWQARIWAYLAGLSDKYPPFSLDNKDDYPVQVTFQLPEHSSRLYAFPVLGGVIRMVLLIPHFVALMVVFGIAGLLSLVAWIPVLFAGRYPTWQYSFQSGLVRWVARVNGYFFGLTDEYPPFRLGA